MQYDVTTPAEYIEALDQDWRKEKIEQLRSIIKTSAPLLKEGINYKMLSYADEKGVVFHLNAQKNHVGFYTGDAKKIDPDGVLLEGIDIGKGCVRFKKSNDIASTQIDVFIAKAITLRDQGENIGC